MHTLLLLLAFQSAAEPGRRVLVLDIEAIGVSADDANAATRLVASAASEVPGVEVVSASDLRRLAALEADKMAAGCEEASCLAEIAGALGAQSVLFGSLSRLGTTTTASLSLYTAADGRTERRSVDVQDLSGLTAVLRERTTDLLAPSSSSSSPPSSSSSSPDEPAGSPLPMIVAVTGGALAVAGGVGIAVSEALVQQPERPGADKANLQGIGRIAVAASVVGVVVGVVGAGLLLAGGE